MDRGPGAVDRVAAATLDLLARRPAGLGPVRLVCVDGPSGSGKTTFARRLVHRARSADRTRVVRRVGTDALATWACPFDWWDRLEQQLFEPLAAGRPGRLVVNEWVDGVPRPGRPLVVPVPDVLVLEGVSAGRRAVAGRAGVLVWVEVPDAARRLDRAVARDGEQLRGELARWQRAEAGHFAGEDTAARADLRLDPTGDADPA
ncbi:uridine kinase family protein [Nakamurella endophytica]|uniref:uridine kinase family protein n=1 Tax=Nakamurella endophytica TaxID=1748367 RepID=UPI001E56A9EC|nr:uridine kinase [Nakamurella endophytica]